MPETFVIVTAARFAEPEPRPSGEQPRFPVCHPALHGPFADDEAALEWVKAQHYTGALGDHTWEYLFPATSLEVEIEVRVEDA